MSKAWLTIKRLLFKSKKKTFDSKLHLTETIIEPIVLHACKIWGGCNKKSKIKVEQFHVSLCKQVLGVGKTTSNIKVLPN